MHGTRIKITLRIPMPESKDTCNRHDTNIHVFKTTKLRGLSGEICITETKSAGCSVCLKAVLWAQRQREMFVSPTSPGIESRPDSSQSIVLFISRKERFLFAHVLLVENCNTCRVF